jgi:eukaryotic-like serine/threonine-protein kinase
MPNRKNRTQALAARSHFWIDDLHVQPDRCVVMRGIEEIKLEQRMMEVLVELAENGGKPVSTGALLDEFWSDDDGNEVYDENPVTKTISTLRSKIGDDARKPRYIRTISRQGYCIIPKVQFAEGYRHAHGEFGTWNRGNPYVGLKPFERGHAEVFQGRSATVSDLMRAMREQIDNERRFVLIVGPSGCGKTSLVHASMIPKVAREAGFDGLHALSVATCDLGTASDGDLMTILAASLAAWRIGDHEFFSLHPQEHLRKMLIEAPEKVSAVIEEGFRRYPVRDIEKKPHAHLLLTIDHAESIVAARNVSMEHRNCFARAIRALCDTPRILTTMIARLDFYPALTDALPELADYRSGHGHFEVATPSEGELAKIIRKPAALAGVDFEEHPKTQVFLDDLLCKKAIAQPDALPLLQHTLHALFKRCGETGLLTYAVYDEIGGLEGAIARRAEEVFGGLPITAHDNPEQVLGRILARLVVIQPDSGAVSASSIVRSRLDSEANQMVQVFIDAHLFVSDLDGGQPIVKVAHEALLRQWPRADHWIKENRRLLQARARLQHAAERWNSEGYPDDHLLNPGRPLGEAQEVSRYLSEEMDEQSVVFLSASERLFKRKKRVRQWIVASLVALSIFSSASAFFAIRAESETRKTLNSLVKQADAFRTVSELVFRNANMRGAEDAFFTAVKTLRSAHENNTESEEILFQYAISSYWLGYLYLHDGNLREARAQWVDYLKSCGKLVDMSPKNTSWRKELSYAYNNIGNIDLRERNSENALKNFRWSLAIKRELLAESGPDPGLTVEYGDTLSWIGSTEESIALPKSALARYTEQIRLLSAHVSTPDATDDHRRQLANALWRSARLSAAIGDMKTAETQIRESALQFERLVDSNKNDDALRKDLANANFEAFRIYSSVNFSDEASRRLESAVHTIELIHMSAESPHAWIRLRETILFHDAMRSKRETRETMMKNAISNLETLYDTHPKQTQIAIDIANARIARGIMHARMNRHQQAIEDWREAAKRIEAFAITSKDHTILQPWISANELLGNESRIREQKRLLIAAGYRE